MKPVRALIPVLVAVGSLYGQSPNVGISISFGVPLGDFREKTYAPTHEVDMSQVEGYDVGFGLQLTMSLPVQKNLAFRFGLGGMSTKGTSTASGYSTIYLRHTMYSLSGDVQLFLDDAYKHRGTYIFAGVSGNFENFERSSDDFWDRWSDLYVDRKTRLGGTVGLGHIFYSPGGMKFFMEFSYNSTLTSKEIAPGFPLSTDYLKLGFGAVF